MAKKILKKIAQSVAKKVASRKAKTTQKRPALKAAAAKKPALKKPEMKGASKKAPVKASKKAVAAVSVPSKKPLVTKKPVASPKAKIAPAKAATEPKSAKQHVLAPAKVSVKVMNRCREVACDSAVVGAGYCRLHYIKNWKQLKAKEQILAEGKLDRFIEELVAKFPDKYIEAIRFDLSNEVEFAKVALDLNLVEVATEEFAADDETASDDGIIDSIKKESIEEIEEF